MNCNNIKFEVLQKCNNNNDYGLFQKYIIAINEQVGIFLLAGSKIKPYWTTITFEFARACALCEV